MRRWTGLAVAISTLVAGCGPSPSPSASQEGPRQEIVPLVEEGETAVIEAVDADGGWGTITITRGPDVGGYPLDEIDSDTFIIEFSIRYEASRQPVGNFGIGDWALASAGDLLPVGQPFEPTQPPDPAASDPRRQPLGILPGAMEMTGSTIEGLVAFQVPRDTAAEHDLVLVYRPEHIGTAAATYLARPAGGDGPEPVPTATPLPTPEPVSYAARGGAPFTVIDHPEADALFGDPDTCTNPVAGYTVTYPDSWFTNTAIGDTPACSWFSPTFYEVGADPNQVPDEIAIVIVVFPGVMGFFNSPDYELHEQISIGGFEGYRYQQIGVTHEGGGYQPLPPTYVYTAILSENPGEGPTMTATTSSEGADDYVLNRAVLDRIMASIAFDE